MNFRIPLQERPVLRQIGAGVHGSSSSETFRLPSLWCVHFYRYEGEVIVNGRCLSIHPGHASVFPPNATLEYHYRGESRHLYAHFTLPVLKDPVARVPAMQALGAAFSKIHQAFEESVGWFPWNPLRAEVRLWDVLWRLAMIEPEKQNADRCMHPSVVRTLQSIELRLDQPLYIGALAREAGFSHNHFTRLFKQALGCGVASWIHGRRVERAVHMLRHTTRPIKAIAAEIGFPDLHAFNKVIHRAFGVSPRAIRHATHSIREK